MLIHPLPLLLALILGSGAAHAASIAAEQGCMPFVGERMLFDVGWEFINAGTATMDVTGTPEAWKIDSLARTNRFFDLFKKVRDTIHAEGVCADGRMQSTLFAIEQHERRYHAKKRAEFDWRHGRVRYTKDGKTEDFEVPAGYLHVLDAFFATRARNLKPGDVLKFPVFDSRKKYEVIVHVQPKLKRKVHLPWGGFADCLVLEPRLKTEGIFSSVGTIRIWVTNDRWHIPVRMTAAIKIGHIVATLREYRRL